MEPVTLFVLIFAIAATFPSILASKPEKPEPSDEEKLAKALAKMLSQKTPASDP